MLEKWNLSPHSVCMCVCVCVCVRSHMCVCACLPACMCRRVCFLISLIWWVLTCKCSFCLNNSWSLAKNMYIQMVMFLLQFGCFLSWFLFLLTNIMFNLQIDFFLLNFLPFIFFSSAFCLWHIPFHFTIFSYLLGSVGLLFQLPRRHTQSQWRFYVCNCFPSLHMYSVSCILHSGDSGLFDKQ